MSVSTLEINEIGVVQNSMLKPKDPFKMKWERSTIKIHEKYKEGLYKIENSEYLQVLFYFHESKEHKKLKGPTYSGEVKGVFACRSPFRPSSIGLTTVKLLERDGTDLIVEGLDAINGTPVIDIKPLALILDSNEIKRIKEKTDLNYPRMEIMKLIRRWDLKTLLKKAGVLHGHYCSGLAFGVMAGAFMMKEMDWKNDGMEKILAITENNNCSSDGIQLMTGCSFGNNSLIFRDFGKMAFTLVNRNGEGIRLSLKNNSTEHRDDNSEFHNLFEKVIKKREGSDEDMMRFKQLARETAFKMIEQDVKDLFNIERVSIKIPLYAPIHDSFICLKCQENTMMTRSAKKNGDLLCFSCAKSEFFELNGFGIQKIDTL